MATPPVGSQWSTGFVDAADMHDRIDVPIDTLYATQQAGPFGSVGHNVLGSPVTGITTAATLAAVAVSVVAGRKYRISTYFEGTQVTTTGILVVNLKIAGTHTAYCWFDSTPPKTVYGSNTYYYAPGSSGSVTFSLVGTTSAGTLSVSAGSQVFVTDEGTA